MNKKQRLTIITASISAALLAILTVIIMIAVGQSFAANYDVDEQASNTSNTILAEPTLPDDIKAD